MVPLFWQVAEQTVHEGPVRNVLTQLHEQSGMTVDTALQVLFAHLVTGATEMTR